VSSNFESKRRRVIIAALIVLLIALVYLAFDRFPAGNGKGRITAPHPDIPLAAADAVPGSGQEADAGAPIAKSIAVLPFTDRSAGATDGEVLAVGLHDDLLNALSAIPGLTVISRGSVAGYRRPDRNAMQIGEELGVGTVLEGALQRAGQQLLIEVQLTDARTGQSVWSQTHDREIAVDTIFGIQGAVVLGVAGALGTDPDSVRQPETPTSSFDAYLAVLISRQLLERNRDEFQKAAEHARRAIELDPEYADAWLALAAALTRGIQSGRATEEETAAEISEAINIAMALRPDYDRTWSTMGDFQSLSGRPGAVTSFETAVRLNPGNAHALFAYGSLMRAAGKPQQALPLLLRASELDPLSQAVLFRLGGTYDVLGKPEESREMYARIRAIDPGSSLGYTPVSGTYLSQGQIDLALFWLDQGQANDPQDFELAGWMVLLYDNLEDYVAAGRWSDWLDSWVTNEPLPMATQASHHYQMGEFETAVQYSNLALRLGMPDRWGSDAIFMRIKRDEALAAGDPNSGIEVFRAQHPGLFEDPPLIDAANLQQAVDLALLLKLADRADEVQRLLVAAIEFYDRPYAVSGSARADLVPAKAEALAILDDEAGALAELRRIIDRGWRLNWRWETELNFNFNGIRKRPEFEAMTIDLQSDMAFQRANIDAMTARGDIRPSPRR
jgi:TolB-like protein/Flp pilus assembly protein TadD